MYRDLAAVYDRLTDIDTGHWADVVEKILRTQVSPKARVLDLACGTGSMSYELASRGYQMVGADLSEEMLAVAEGKLRKFAVPLFKADMRRLPPLGDFDAVICLSDSMNYLASQAELAEVFQGLHKLNPKLLIFDLNTPYYLGQVLGDNSFSHVEEDLAYIWENGFDPGRDLCEMRLTFFVKSPGGPAYARFDEVHLEKAFKLARVEELLGLTGWNLSGVYDGYSGRPAGIESERWLFVSTKV